MTRKEALADLIAKVEAGIHPQVMDANRRVAELLDGWPFQSVMSAYNGSLNAALALHEAVLPGWTVNSLHQVRQPDSGMPQTGQWTCLMFRYSPTIAHIETKAGTPARAWLLAILKALHAQDGEA